MPSLPWSARAPTWLGAASLGIAVLACTGGEPAPPAPPPAPEPEVAPEVRHLGTWRAAADERRLRQLRIIEAATSDVAQKRERLGDLTPDEQALFDQWRGKRGPDADAMADDLRRLRQMLLDFDDEEVSVKFGESDSHGPVSYERVSASAEETVLTFDPGLGHGVETHHIRWESDDLGRDARTAADGTPLDELTLTRKGEARVPRH